MKPLLCCVALILGIQALGAEGLAHPSMPIGSSLPEFDLPGVDGKRHGNAEYAGAKVLAIIFTCNHCPTAQAYEERIKALARDYQPRGVAVIAVSPNSPAAVRLDELGYTDLGDDLDDMKIRSRERGFNFPYLFDGETESFSLKLGPATTPHVFLFGPDRKLEFSGRIDDSEREDRMKVQDTRLALDALLAGRKPAVTETRVFGCSTKWGDKAAGNLTWREKVKKEPVTVKPADVAALKALRENADSGKVRLINVWATWCGPCVSEFDELIETNLRFRHRDFEVVTVSAQFPDEQAAVAKFLAKHNASTRNVIFAEGDKDQMLGAIDPEWKGALPHTLLVAPGGKVLYRQTGDIDFLELRRRIVPALNAITPWAGMK